MIPSLWVLQKKNSLNLLDIINSMYINIKAYCDSVIDKILTSDCDFSGTPEDDPIDASS